MRCVHLLLVLVGAGGLSAEVQATDPGWPRVFKSGGQQLTVHQPQVDYWHGYTNLHFRCAIAVKGVLKEEKFGVAEIDALTITDQGARVVAVVPLKREFRFGGVSPTELQQLRDAVNRLNPDGQVTTISLDRVLAYLDPKDHPVQPAAELNLEPPPIFGSSRPAILVMFMGEPKFMAVESNRTDLLFALNTNWDVLLDTASGQYFLLNGDGWLTTSDVLKGPWTAAPRVPPSFQTLPANDNWAEARKRLPGTPPKVVPSVFTTTRPAELIVTDGPPNYAPIRGTKLLRVTNTASTLFLHTGDGKLYFLVAGRWFRGGGLTGPWAAASADLPADFAQIPDKDPAAFVRASVPGTREAQDAVLLASIPTTTTVNVTNNINLTVSYSGQPQFVVITNTVVQYAVNTPKQVFLVSGKYYCCDQGVWFESKAATGPWTLCVNVPSAIYTIPPGNPNYNVTYVVVQSSSPGSVTYSQTSGYSGEYVAKTGVLMFGVGMVVGAAIANNNDSNYYYYPPPCHYSYGCGATYHYGYGGYYGAGAVTYGPYGGAGYATGYNPSTGTYARSSYAYGPYGSASGSAAYNPYTGQYAQSAQVNSVYGSAGGARTYNAQTGQYSAAAYRTSAYGTSTAQRSYNAYTGDSGVARQVTTTGGGTYNAQASYDGQTGSRSASQQVTTASGNSASRAAAYNPTTGQGATAKSVNTANTQATVAKTTSGDYYASNGDTVYKKDSSGNWTQNSGSGWESMESPQQQAQAQASTKQQQAQSQATAKQQQMQSQSGTYQQQAQAQASSRQQQMQSQAGTYQQQAQARASSASAQSAAAASSLNQQQAQLHSQAQARYSGNQQAARTSQFQSSAAARSGGGGRRR